MVSYDKNIPRKGLNLYIYEYMFSGCTYELQHCKFSFTIVTMKRDFDHGYDYIRLGKSLSKILK